MGPLGRGQIYPSHLWLDTASVFVTRVDCFELACSKTEQCHTNMVISEPNGYK